MFSFQLNLSQIGFVGKLSTIETMVDFRYTTTSKKKIAPIFFSFKFWFFPRFLENLFVKIEKQ